MHLRSDRRVVGTGGVGIAGSAGGNNVTRAIQVPNRVARTR